MAFVPGYGYDVFVSYAHINDQPYLEQLVGRERPSGWVSTFVRLLKIELAQKIGRVEAFDVCFDAHNLRGNQRLTDEIARQLGRSANFLAVLSPGYCASQWCRDEARLFADRHAADLANRVFVVEMAQLNDTDTPPPELQGLRNYRFWYRDRTEQARTFASPVPHAEELEYFRLIQDLAHDLRNQMMAMAAAPPAAPSGPAVFLAAVPDQLVPRRAEVQRYLEQLKLPILPGPIAYPREAAGFKAALERDLEKSVVFAQLLAPEPEPGPPDLPEGYAWAQLEAAQRRGLKILQWRSPDIDPETVSSTRHRELLELPTVQATSLGSFERAIAAALAPPPPPLKRDTGDRPLVFLNTEPRHLPIAAQIRGALGERAVWAEPLFEGSSEVMREDLERNVIDCDAMVMVYADNPGWARAQLRTYTKLAPRREHPVRALPLIDAPPEEKPDLGFFLPEMVVIDGRHGVGPEAIERLSATLQL